ncbi:unnamed protein product [Polarella glacialis]|uniref:Uncharacterized protein n=1 Tax=Polarella glacialis TaxID=89957 RepID=A0A813EP98_POLGL|nr:unnamed protein product [Polarella glacialis]CAE8641679.1 unnamed protein product [Polarella glacialis]
MAMALPDGVPHKERPAGLSTERWSSCGLARSELAMKSDKTKLRLRGHVSPCRRSFKFSDSMGPDGGGGSSPRALPRAVVCVPGSPRGSASYQGVSAGKLMELFRRDCSSVSWPHRRGSGESLASLEPSGFTRSVSPSFLRDSGNLGRGGLSRSGGGILSPRLGSETGAQAKPLDLAALAATVAAAAEKMAEVDVLAIGGVGPDGSTRALSPRVRESHWVEGLSPRTAERGGSRFFPCHLASPRSRGGSPPGSPRGQLVSPRGSSGYRSARITMVPSSEQPKRSPRSSPRGSLRVQGSDQTGQALGSGQLPAWAAARHAQQATSSSNGEISKIKSAQAAMHVSNSNNSSAQPRTSNSSFTNHMSSGKAVKNFEKSTPTVANTSSAPETARTSQASRLQELREKLESKLRSAEEGIHADLKLLDQRLADSRRRYD